MDNSGAVYSYYLDGSEWLDYDKLVASDGSSYDYFGSSVSIDGNYAIVGAYGDDDKGYTSGSAYVFSRSGSEWDQQSKLMASDGSGSDYFGYSVSISGDYAIVGAYQDDDNGNNSGSAYIFSWDGTDWVEQQKLTASDGYSNDYFGYTVSISGNYAIVGAYQDDDNGDNSGSAYIFSWDGTDWVQQQKLIASDVDRYDNSGCSVSIDGDYAIVGASRAGSGAAYVYHWDGTTWSEQAKLSASDGAGLDMFGSSVSIEGDYVAIGAYGDDDNGSWSGSAYIFQRDGTTWTQTEKLTASDGASIDLFGQSVAIAGDYAIVGARRADTLGQDSGTAYIDGDLNQPPEASDDTGVGFTTDEDTSFTTGNVLDNDSDPDSGDTISLVSYDDSSLTAGTLTSNGDGTFVFDPNGEFESLAVSESTTENFTYTIEDDDGAQDTATVTITITGVNDAPTVSAAVSASASEDASAFSVNLLDNAGDVDASDVLSVDNLTLVSGDDSGVTAGTGSLTVDPSAYDALAGGQNEVIEFTYDVIDGNGGSVAQTATITIFGANDAAAITGTAAGALKEDDATTQVSGTLTVTDPDTGQAVFQTPADLSGTYGTCTFDASTGAWTYTIDNNDPDTDALVAGEVVTDSLTVTSADGTANETISITITGANDAAVISGTATGTLIEDDPTTLVSGSLTVSDADFGQAVFQTPADLSGTYGMFTFDASTGAWTYTIDNNDPDTDELTGGEIVTDSLTVTSADGTANETIIITVNGANDAAVISGTGTGALTEDDPTTQVSGTLFVNDADSGEAVFQTPADLSGTYGAFTFNASTGAWTYTIDNNDPDTDALFAGEIATDSLTVTSADGTASETIVITITGANDAPVLTVDATGTVAEDASAPDLTDSGTLSYSDVDAGDTVTLTYTYNNDATWSGGTLTPIQGGYLIDGFSADSDSWEYSVANEDVQFMGSGETVTFSYDVTVTDQHGASDTKTVTITIFGENDDTLYLYVADGVTDINYDGTPSSGTLTSDGTPFSWSGYTSVVLIANSEDNTITVTKDSLLDELDSGEGSDTIILAGGTVSGTIWGGEGDDTLTVDFSNGTPAADITFDGGGETDPANGDSVVLTGGNFTDVIYTFFDEHSGTIELDGLLITYYDLEPITSSIDAVNVTLNYSGVDETITIADAGGGQTTVDSTAGEVVTFANPTGSLTINTGGGNDSISFESLDSGFSAKFVINGEDDNDTLYLHVPDGAIDITYGGTPTWGTLTYDGHKVIWKRLEHVELTANSSNNIITITDKSELDSLAAGDGAEHDHNPPQSHSGVRVWRRRERLHHQSGNRIEHHRRRDRKRPH